MGMDTTSSSPKRTNRTKKKQKSELDLETRAIRKQKKKLRKQRMEIRALRKRNRKLMNELLDDKLAQITDDDDSPKERKEIKEDSTNNFEYFEPTSDVKDEIIDRDISQEEEEEKRRENFKLAMTYIPPALQGFLELYLNYSQSPSLDEAEEAFIQVEHLGVHSLEELLDIVDKLWKESDSTADTVMENFVRQFPFITLSPSFPFYHRLIVEVISYELKRSVTSSTTCSQNVSSQAPSSSYTPDVSFTRFPQNDTSTEESTIIESCLISQDNIIPENATTKTYTIPEENTTTGANTCTQAYTTTEVDTIAHGNYSVEGTFKCSLCDLVFRTEADLRSHKTRPHRYNLLKKKFLSQDNPRKGQVNPTFLCPHCADLIPYNERHNHMITHQIEHFKCEKLKSEMKEVFQG